MAIFVLGMGDYNVWIVFGAEPHQYTVKQSPFTTLSETGQWNKQRELKLACGQLETRKAYLRVSKNVGHNL